MVTPRPSILRTLAILICTIILSFFVVGCGKETRTTWEAAFPWTRPILIDTLPDGTQVVGYPDKLPRICPVSGEYTRTSGMHVNHYAPDGVLVKHWFQRDGFLINYVTGKPVTE